MGGSYLVEVCAFTFMALLVAREGTLVSGGHQIMSNLAALCYMMPMALGVATAALTAQAIGSCGKSGIVVASAPTREIDLLGRQPFLDAAGREALGY